MTAPDSPSPSVPRWDVTFVLPVVYKTTVGYADFEGSPGADNVDWTDLEDVEAFLEDNGDELYQMVSGRHIEDVRVDEVQIDALGQQA